MSWLRDYIEVELEPERLAERLTMLGMEVKAIDRRGADWQNVVVGELLSVERHPRADLLSLTRVTVGGGEPLEIVCGATNIAPGPASPGRAARRGPARRPTDRANREARHRQQRDALLGRRARADR